MKAEESNDFGWLKLFGFEENSARRRKLLYNDVMSDNEGKLA